MREERQGEGFAPGKLLLFGEHAVVYGAPAVGVPLEKGVKAFLREGQGRVEAQLGPGLTLPSSARAAAPKELVGRALGELSERVDAHLELDVPPMCGYGSSAAVAVAVLRAKADFLRRKPPGRRALWSSALDVERAAHATPSGVDPAVVVWHQPIIFARDNDKISVRKQVFGKPVYMVAGWCGAHGGTRVTVTGLATLRKSRPKLITAAMDTLAEASRAGSNALRRGEHDALGPALDLAHGVLGGLGLVGDAVEGAVRAARAAGALGAKMSGAGGAGGAWLALFRSAQKAKAACNGLQNQGYVARVQRLG